MAFSLNSDVCGIPYVLRNHPAYAGFAWTHAYEPGQDPDSWNYEGLNWHGSAETKPTDIELTALWTNTYKAQWQASGEGSPWTELRQNRDRLLAETDWTANSDVTMSDDMRTYRQALRDLPANTSDPENVTYPTKP